MRRKLFTLLAALALLLCVAAIVIGCAGRISNIAKPEVALPPTAGDVPFLFIWHEAGLSSHAQFGLIAAIWTDGRFVRVESEDKIGESYVRGHLTPAQLASVRTSIQNSGILSSSWDGSVPVDATRESLGLRWGDSFREWSDVPVRAGGTGSAMSVQIDRMKKTVLSLALGDAVSEPPEKWKVRPPSWPKWPV